MTDGDEQWAERARDLALAIITLAEQRQESASVLVGGCLMAAAVQTETSIDQLGLRRAMVAAILHNTLADFMRQVAAGSGQPPPEAAAPVAEDDPDDDYDIGAENG